MLKKWWQSRKDREAEIVAQEEKMAIALSKLDERGDSLQDGEVDSIEREVTDAAQAALLLLEDKDQ